MTLSIKPDIWQVLLPMPLKDAFDYSGGAAPGLARGVWVKVPFGKKTAVGAVWEKIDQSPLPPDKIKSIAEILDLPPLSGDFLSFLDWAAHYTMQPKGAILKMAMGEKTVFAPPKKPRKKLPVPPCYRAPETLLNDAQQEAAQDLCGSVSAQKFSVTLLEGITGSGKTEVYFQAVHEALRQGKQVLVLLPEISLSSQFLRRFEQSFGAAPLLWHSQLTPATRRENWLSIAKGDAKVIVGARSALFLPYPDLGLIVVDEEHEQAYKQEEGVIYHGRDMAVARAQKQNIPIVLVSATPSLESLANVDAGKYQKLHLPERFGGAAHPETRLIDLRGDKMPAGQFISPQLARAMQENFEKKQQSLLFLNRRGYAPLTLCRACGQRMQCKNCSSWLVEHARLSRLSCHHCGFSMPKPNACPACKAEGKLHALGPGVERIAAEAQKILPHARIAQFSSDSASHPDQIAAIVQGLELGEIDVVVGTQMVAKGYHFPNLTLVGVVDADLGLAGGDLRAAERTYQLLLQVSGRAGRAEQPGVVYLQSYQGEHPVMQALLNQDAEKFIALQMEERKALHMPPFARLASVILSCEKENMVQQYAAQLAQRVPKDVKDVRVLGPAPAPLAVLRGQHRMRFLIKAPKNFPIQYFIAHWLRQIKKPANLRVLVDIDPYNFI